MGVTETIPPMMALGGISGGPPQFPYWRNWGELMLAIALSELPYLAPEVPTIDTTVGRRVFWKHWQPDLLVTNDIDPRREADHRWDWFADPIPPGLIGKFGAAVFDPDFKLCLDYETEALTRRGWLRYDEVRAGDMVWSLDPDTGTAGWEEVSRVNIYPPEPTKVAVHPGKTLDFVATLDHRWPVTERYKGGQRWVTTEEITSYHGIQQAAPSARPTVATISDAIVELVAWYWTEGHTKAGSTYTEIAQSFRVNPGLCDRIAWALETEFGSKVDQFPRTGRSSTPMWRSTDSESRGMRFFYLSAAAGAQVIDHCPGKIPTLEFLEALTADQLERYIEVSILADGQNAQQLAQFNQAAADRFELACILAGKPVSRFHDDASGHRVRILSHSVRYPAKRGPLAFEDRFVGVWCPTVPATGTWFARRNGTTYFTGNSGTNRIMLDRYGLDNDDPNLRRAAKLVVGALATGEALEIGGYLLIKCQPQVASKRFHDQPRRVTNELEAHGFEHVDTFLRQYRPIDQPEKTRKDGADVVQEHARRNYSELTVMRKTADAVVNPQRQLVPTS